MEWIQRLGSFLVLLSLVYFFSWPHWWRCWRWLDLSKSARLPKYPWIIRWRNYPCFWSYPRESPAGENIYSWLTGSWGEPKSSRVKKMCVWFFKIHRSFGLNFEDFFYPSLVGTVNPKQWMINATLTNIILYAMICIKITGIIELQMSWIEPSRALVCSIIFSNLKLELSLNCAARALLL